MLEGEDIVTTMRRGWERLLLELLKVSGEGVGVSEATTMMMAMWRKQLLIRLLRMSRERSLPRAALDLGAMEVQRNGS